MAITIAAPSLAMSATVEPRSRPSSSASSSPPPPPSLLVGFLMDLVGYVEDTAAASPCDLPTREYAPSSPCACQVSGGFFVRLLSKRRNSFLRLVDQLEKGKWVSCARGETSQFSNSMVLRPLVMVLMLKTSPSSPGFPACVASHGGRGSNSSSSNTALNATTATCDIPCS
ncbi:unnamed protein product [Musa acuminata subsp. malaccensis]|uniref:(wild Malaysian banana) hypothetical protein n=1 Tax=Musa acuminata subsp. malaccensis TaxID=214687 RepID=A0A804J8H9_MUSAM|nr:unnamed protein product [Musa acuminata subsp. malaccensis]